LDVDAVVSRAATVLNLLQGLQLARTSGVPEAADRAAAPMAADTMACYWDELFGAVCVRLTQLAERSTEPTIRAGVSECVAALTQLGAGVAPERALHRQRELELLALRETPAKP
jgi:hypothetical protein